MKIIDYTFDDNDDQKISGLINGRKNLPYHTQDLLDTLDYQLVYNDFSSIVIPMLDPNKQNKIENGIIQILENDNSILANTEIDLISHCSKKDICAGRYQNSLLAGVFLYVLIYTSNRNTHLYSHQISHSLFFSISDQRKKIKMEETNKDNISERAKQFCITYENQIELLPLCQIAMHLNPLHNHHRTMYNEYNSLPVEIQKEINCLSGINWISFPSDWYSKCLNSFISDTRTKQLSSREFLYDDAKYLKKSLDHSATPWEDFDPYIFPCSTFSSHLNQLKTNLTGYIENYLSQSNDTDHRLEEPMNLLWSLCSFDSCQEDTFSFWCNRFVLSTCHNLVHQPSSIYFIEEYLFETLEDLYYAAIWAIFNVYQDSVSSR